MRYGHQIWSLEPLTRMLHICWYRIKLLFGVNQSISENVQMNWAGGPTGELETPAPVPLFRSIISHFDPWLLGFVFVFVCFVFCFVSFCFGLFLALFLFCFSNFCICFKLCFCASFCFVLCFCFVLFCFCLCLFVYLFICFVCLLFLFHNAEWHEQL